MSPLKTVRQALEEAIEEQWSWLLDHGGTVEGYIARYGATGCGGKAIYAADRHALALLGAKLASLPLER